jgi:hypothetical protein
MAVSPSLVFLFSVQTVEVLPLLANRVIGLQYNQYQDS